MNKPLNHFNITIFETASRDAGQVSVTELFWAELALQYPLEVDLERGDDYMDTKIGGYWIGHIEKSTIDLKWLLYGICSLPNTNPEFHNLHNRTLY